MAHTDSSAPGRFSDLTNREIPEGLLEGSTPKIEGVQRYDADLNDNQHVAEDRATMPSGRHWLSEMTCGVAALDRWHHDFVRAMNEASASKDHEFCSRYGALISKAEHAFRQEERWMEEVDFPILKVCQEQHARVLGALHNVHSRVMEGDLGLGREVVDQLLPHWFAFHASTVDATLALAMQVAQTEKKPLADGSIDRFDDLPPYILTRADTQSTRLRRLIAP